MITAVALMVANFCPSQVPAEPWAECEDFTHFVELANGEGAAYQTREGKVVFLSESGGKDRQVEISDDQKALYYSESDGLVVAPAKYLHSVKDDGSLGPVYRTILYDSFARWNHVFTLGGALVYNGEDNLFTTTTFDYLSAAGISRDADTIAVLTSPMDAPILTISRRDRYDWHTESSLLSPEIRGLGLVSISRGFNDLCFISDDVVVYVGRLLPFLNWTPEGLESFESNLMNLRPEDRREGSRRLYVYVTHVRRRHTRAVAMFDVGVSGERGNAQMGQLTVSPDMEHLYLRIGSGIWRLEVTDLLASLERQTNYNGRRYAPHR